jgi:hypothetical protein
MVECPECEGYGEIRHPRWGARNCPEPTMPCPLCRGNCEVSQATADDWNDHQAEIQARLGQTVQHESYTGEEEPF